MSSHLFHLREFLETKYPTPIAFDEKQVEVFDGAFPQIAETIYFDVRRSLWRYKPLFARDDCFDPHKTCRTLQCIFNRFVRIIWSNTKVHVQKSYYQGVTDILEIVYGAYINFNEVVRNIESLMVTDDEYRDYTGDIARFFNEDYQMAVGIGIQIMYQMFRETQFEQHQFMAMGESIFQHLRAQDKRLMHRFAADTDREVLIASFLQYTTSFFLHFTTNLPLSCVLARIFIGMTKAGQVCIAQKIISWCAARFTNNYKQQVDGLELINTCVSELLSKDQNCLELALYLKQVLREEFGGAYLVYWR